MTVKSAKMLQDVGLSQATHTAADGKDGNDSVKDGDAAAGDGREDETDRRKD